MALVSLLAASVLLVAQTATAVAAPTRFGAALDNMSQPANAESGRLCSDEISSADTCTWVSTEAYHNGGHQAAPRTGTIGTLKLVSCIGGSFIVQIATPASGHRARVLRNGPTINYKGDPKQVCGGADGNAYIVQSFAVNFNVTRGDLIGIYASRVGPLYCAGGNGVDLYNPPLGASSAYRTRSKSTSCNLMIQLTYK
jgi:hypothetical protein